MANGEMVDKQSDLGACAFELPNGQNPQPHKPMFYGNQSVPHPTNIQAKLVDHAKIMRQVLDAD
jgi:hypothetical protein